MALKKIDIGYEFSRGWTLFKENMGLFVVAALLAMILTLISCGILSGSMATQSPLPPWLVRVPGTALPALQPLPNARNTWPKMF